MKHTLFDKILFLLVVYSGNLFAWDITIINNTNATVSVKINLIAAPRCKVAYMQPHSTFTYPVGAYCTESFRYNNKEVKTSDGCANQLLIINGPRSETLTASLSPFSPLQKEIGTHRVDVTGSNCQNHLIYLRANNIVAIKSSVGYLTPFMFADGVKIKNVLGNSCVNHRLFISKYDNNKVTLKSDINPLPDYYNDALTCKCGSYTLTYARDTIDNRDENIKFCSKKCGPPVTIKENSTETFKEVAPAKIDRRAHKDSFGVWHANMDAITCTCENGVKFTRSGYGKNVDDNNRYCAINCKKGYKEGNIAVDEGEAPDFTTEGNTIFHNSRKTQWMEESPEYHSLATIGT